MNEATREAFRTQRPNERGFVLTRAGYAGVQRNAAVWTGDNHSWWEHIGLMIPMLANLGLSGVAFAGGDVGGFQLNASGELYARWIAAAALTPFFRAHSALDTHDHEPWSFGEEVLAVARRYVGLRYRLMPYLYTLFEEASRRGSPVVRPLVWEFPRDPRVANRADSYMVGSSLLVAPVGTPGVQERSVYLPAGDAGDGYGYRNGEFWRATPRVARRGAVGGSRRLTGVDAVVYDGNCCDGSGARVSGGVRADEGAANSRTTRASARKVRRLPWSPSDKDNQRRTSAKIAMLSSTIRYSGYQHEAIYLVDSD